ncbi:hypothetical protein ONS96_007810 [Cadophora gregata f. sp. sojae]|nr:hypothetical protein ONS96_007810 [Cadophora gregata f. sp. sojae]
MERLACQKRPLSNQWLGLHDLGTLAALKLTMFCGLFELFDIGPIRGFACGLWECCDQTTWALQVRLFVNVGGVTAGGDPPLQTAGWTQGRGYSHARAKHYPAYSVQGDEPHSRDWFITY